MIRTARQARQLSQAVLAKTVGVSAVHVSQIETGQRTPSDRVAKDIALTLGLHWQEILRHVYSLRSSEATELFLPTGEGATGSSRTLVTDIPAVRTLLLRLAGLNLSHRELEAVLRNWANDLEMIGQLGRAADQ
jgi:transcriptional regulator with XRE-family HTH domain